MKKGLRLRTETLRPLDRGALAGAAGASLFGYYTTTGANLGTTLVATRGPATYDGCTITLGGSCICG